MRLNSILVSLVLVCNNCCGESSYTAKKCCPEKYALNARLECVPSTHHWYYMNVTVTGLPKCKFTAEFAEEGVSAYCFDNSFETSSYLMVMCEGKVGTGPDRRVPPVNYIRKCCRFGRFYDTTSQSCRRPESSESAWPRAFFNIFLSRSRGGVDVNFGLGVCNEVLVDFVLHYTRAFRDASEAIVLSVPGRSEMRFNPDEVCLDLTETSEIVVIRACTPAEGVCAPKDESPRAWKCCPNGFSVVEGKCAEIDLAHPKTGRSRRPDRVPSYHGGPVFAFGSLCGINGSVLKGGHLSGGVRFHRNFCVHHSESINTNYVPFFEFKGFNVSASVETCQRIVFSTSITSSVSLFFAILLYCCMLNLKNSHNKTMCFYLISLLIGLTSLTISQGIKMKTNNFTNLNQILGYAYHFGIFCTFLWLTVASFSIWMTFGRARDKRRPGIPVEIAWIIAIIYIVLLIVADRFELVSALSHNTTQYENCLVDKSLDYVIYSIMPKSIGLAIGFILIILSALKCECIKDNSALQGKQYLANKEKLTTIFKVLLIHFLTLSFEIILQLLQPETKIWYTLLITTSLQGFVIFVVLIVNESFLKLMYRKFKKCKCRVTLGKVHSSTVFTT